MSGKAYSPRRFPSASFPNFAPIHWQIGFQASTQMFSAAANKAQPKRRFRLHDGVAAGGVQTCGALRRWRFPRERGAYRC